MAVPFRTRRALLATTAALSLLVASCADFPDDPPRHWTEQPSLEPQAGPEPSYEAETPHPAQPPSSQRADAPRHRVGCHDPDPAVQATCLEPIGAVAVLPDGDSALVAERTTGRVLRVRRGTEPVEIARVPVDPTNGGGLTGLALSPSYAEDELIYAYATTGEDNRVLRIATDDRPKPVLTGIPKGPAGNAGALLDDDRGGLLVATGDAGEPARANEPNSLAGKVLRVDGLGRVPADNPDPTSRVVASGLHTPGGLCGTRRSGGYWVTDRGSDQDSTRGGSWNRDALQRIQFGHALGAPEWTWRNDPGVAGCTADSSSVVVALRDAAAMYALTPAGHGTFTGNPTPVLDDTYGRFSALASGSDGLLWAATANRDGGDPVSSDDRVLRIEPPSGGTSGKD